MKKKLILLMQTILLFSCISTNKTSDKTVMIKNTPTEIDKDSAIMRKAISDNVLLEADPHFSDFASIILDLINKKDWESLSNFSDRELYNSYLVDSNSELIDYCMYIFFTGDVGISTNYSLNEINSAFYTNTYMIEDTVVFEGLYIYPSDESEFFKIILREVDGQIIITRE